MKTLLGVLIFVVASVVLTGLGEGAPLDVGLHAGLLVAMFVLGIVGLFWAVILLWSLLSPSIRADMAKEKAQQKEIARAAAERIAERARGQVTDERERQPEPVAQSPEARRLGVPDWQLAWRDANPTD